MVERGTALPDFKHQKWINFSRLERNIPTLVLFWSVSCGQCSTILKKCQREQWHEDPLFNFITVHMPRSIEDMEEDKVVRHCKQLKLEFPVIDDVQFSVADYFQNQFVPSLYLFNKHRLFEKKLNVHLPKKEIIKKIHLL